MHNLQFGLGGVILKSIKMASFSHYICNPFGQNEYNQAGNWEKMSCCLTAGYFITNDWVLTETKT